jgi:hypothetical protein
VTEIETPAASTIAARTAPTLPEMPSPRIEAIDTISGPIEPLMRPVDSVGSRLSPSIESLRSGPSVHMEEVESWSNQVSDDSVEKRKSTYSRLEMPEDSAQAVLSSEAADHRETHPTIYSRLEPPPSTTGPRARIKPQKSTAELKTQTNTISINIGRVKIEWYDDRPATRPSRMAKHFSPKKKRL